MSAKPPGWTLTEREARELFNSARKREDIERVDGFWRDVQRARAAGSGRKFIVTVRLKPPAGTARCHIGDIKNVAWGDPPSGMKNRPRCLHGEAVHDFLFDCPNLPPAETAGDQVPVFILGQDNTRDVTIGGAIKNLRRRAGPQPRFDLHPAGE